MLSLFLSLYHRLFFGLAGIAGIGLLIVVHELGHFLFCKLFRVSTPTFSIGLGPKLFSKKIGETHFTLSTLPFGGYVEIAGLAEVGQGDQKQANQSDQYAFSSKPYYQKLLILLGGILFNILFAFLAFWSIFWMGTPKSPLLYPANATTTITAIKEGSPQQALFKANDSIIAINDISVKDNVVALENVIHPLANQEVTISLIRNNEPLTLVVPVTAQTINRKISGILNVQFKLQEQAGKSIVSALKDSASFTWFWMKNTFNAYTNLIRSRNTANVGGPLSLFEASIKGASQGLAIFLALLAIISINLAILNLIPLPIADGGQILIQTIESLFRRAIPTKIKEYVFMASWLFFIGLALYFSAKDIIRMTGSYLGQFISRLGF